MSVSASQAPSRPLFKLLSLLLLCTSIVAWLLPGKVRAAPSFIFLAEERGPTAGTSLNGAFNIEIVGNYAYIPNYVRDSLAILDISNPNDPVFLGEVVSSTLNGAADVTVVGNYAYVVNQQRDSLAVVDISNPYAPVFLAEERGPTPGTSLDGAAFIQVVGNYAYVTNQARDSIAVLDISNPNDPVFLAEERGSGILDAAYGFVVDGNYAYIANYTRDSLAVVDISNPNDPVYLSEERGPSAGTSLDGAYGIAVVGNYAYVTTYGRDSLAVLDISNPNDPVFLAEERGPTPGTSLDGAYGVAVVDNYAYVVNYTRASLAVIQITGLTTAPTLTTNAASSITSSSATLNANITATGGANATARGFARATNAAMTTDVSTSTEAGSFSTGAFTQTLTGLTPGTTYYFRAYAANAAGTSTGSIFSFSTPSAATVVTNAAANVATSTATLNGYLSNTGGLTGAGTSYGFANGTSTTLTGSNVATTSLGTYSGTGSFSASIAGLEQGATYYFRAYAANSAGTSTGGIIPFTTQTRPTVVTNAASAEDVFSATLNGNITATGGDNATVRGFAWGTNSALASGVSTTTASGSFGTGSFTYDLSSLIAGTTYYYRAYATNPQGTSYGTITSATTLADTLTLDTQPVSNITHSIATFSANITAARAGLQRGFAYSTNANLSSGVSTSTLGTYAGSGSMQETVIGLNADTTYYVRAYATKSDSTSYGNIVSFTTQKNRTGGASIYAAALGAGVVSGGDSGGIGGDEIGSEVDFYAPTSVTTVSGGGLTGASSGYASDGAYATAAASAASNYHTFGFNIPPSDVITGIAVKLEVSASTAAGSVGVELSWDGGSSVTQTGRTTPTLTTSDAVHLLGGASDTWGRSWVPSELNSGNFGVRVTGNPSSNTVRLDALQVRVYHQATGGSGGGGGEI